MIAGDDPGAHRETRRLAAIVAADVVGFSRLVGSDEEGTLRALRAHRQELIDPLTNAAPFTIELPRNVAVASDVDPLVFDALGRATTDSGVVTDASISVGGLPLEAVGETGLVRVP